MCGIVGIVRLDVRETVDEARLKRMRDVLRHRGPDGAGVYLGGPVGLGHRRLAIVDVDGGGQPMCTEDGKVWIVCNGEVYNHPDLRQRLESLGHHYRSRSDTETILHLYEEEPDGCVEKLRGMFAFALWDEAKRRLVLARDRLGIKPLYYAVTDRELVFASEIKAILASGAVKAEFNREVLPEYLATGYVSGEETFFRGVRKLLPGRTLTWSPDEGLEERRYWRPVVEPNGHGANLELAARGLREQLEASVRSHLMSDVPLGLFLSGGVDSTALAALMAPMLREPIRTFAVGFGEAAADERVWARRAAQAVGAVHREVVLSPERFFDALPRLVWHEDEPIAFPSSVPLYFLSRLAREHVKVVLTGEGSDELFLGYNRYRVTAWNERLDRCCGRFLPLGVRRSAGDLLRALPRPIRRYASRTFLAMPPGPRSLIHENFAVFPTGLQRRILADEGLVDAHDPYAETLRLSEEVAGGTLERMAHADLQTYLVELLMKQDQMSMAASIETRVPFLDHELVELAASIPGRLKLRGLKTKAVLRAAVRDVVPREILARRKMGFPVPVGRWLRGRFWPVVEDLVLGPRALGRGLFDAAAVRRLAEEHRVGAAAHGERLWLLMNLETWQRVFLDREDPPAIHGAVDA